MFHRFLSISLCGLGFALFAAQAYAQNTGGVFPTQVNEGHSSLQYRVAINPDSAKPDSAQPDDAKDEFGFAQRLHYQQAINGDLMWRVVGQTQKTDSSDLDFAFLQAELFWEISDDEDQHKTGLRFDARLTDGDKAEQLGVNWMNQFNFENGWHARAVVLSSVQIGDTAANGLGLQTRARVGKKLETGQTIGVEMYNAYGRTTGFGSFDDQSHTIGPFISAPLGNKVSVFAGPLFGLSRAAPDVEARLWLTKGF